MKKLTPEGEALFLVGVKLAEAEKARAEAIEEMKTMLSSLRDSGMPISDMANLAGVTRRTIYTWLEPPYLKLTQQGVAS